MRIGDVIEAVALRRNVAYREYFDSIKFSRRINYHTTMDPMYEEYNCQMKEVVSSRCTINKYIHSL